MHIFKKSGENMQVFIKKFKYRFRPVHKRSVVHYKRKNRLNGFMKRIILILTITITLSVIGCKNAEPYLAEKGLSKIQATITVFANETALEVIGNDNFYNDIIISEKNESGEIISVKTDILKANRLKSEIMIKLQEKLDNFDNVTVFLPFGAVFGKSVFSSYGFNVPVKILGINNLSVDLTNDFTSAGINQTRHLIQLNIKINASVLALLNRQGVDIVTQIPVSDTIIVGDTPKFYAGKN